MATDYDEPRIRPEDEPKDETLSSLTSRPTLAKHAQDTAADEANLNEDMELPGADLSHLELEVEVVPRQDNEFTCGTCFLVHHVAARATRAADLCRDCA